MKPAVVLLSGGLDSTTLLHQLLYEDYNPIALSIRYGQRHVQELLAAERVAAWSAIHLVKVEAEEALAPIFEGADSSQVGLKVDVPEGHYADESMKSTIVPNRNMILLSVAGALAVTAGASIVAYAAHAGDHPIYPDCRPDFAQAFGIALAKGTGGAVRLYTPFIEITKTDIVRRGNQLNVPFELTYSCYAGRETHCGRCGTCVERREAFSDAGVTDPTIYEDVAVA